jgi:hypothetical protein
MQSNDQEAKKPLKVNYLNKCSRSDNQPHAPNLHKSGCMRQSSISSTVKLGYDELCYNKHPVITNKMKSNGWFKSFSWHIFLVITNKTRL